MATVLATPTANLCTALGGNVPSTNVAQRQRVGTPAAVVITSAIGATPTVTVALQGSVDGVNWYSVAYALVGTPETLAVANLTITTAVTTVYLLRADHAWRYFRLLMSANTNVTLTADFYE